MTKTLKDIILSGAWRNYTARDGMLGLEPRFIEQALYGAQAQCSHDEWGHLRAFEEGESILTVELNAHVCWDTKVGLYMLVLNDEPVAITWQPYRKSENDITFISKESMTVFREAWERHRPETQEDACFVSDDMLNLLISDPGQEGLDIDKDSPADNLRLEVASIAKWVKAQGGESMIHDGDVLNTLYETAHLEMTRCAKTAQEMQARFDEKQEQFNATGASKGILDTIESQQKRADLISLHLVVPFKERLAALGIEKE